MPKKKELSFEESLGRLEFLVREMESGDLKLKDLMAHYEEGIGLSQKCLQELDAAETVMDKILQESGGQWIEKPLQIEEENIC